MDRRRGKGRKRLDDIEIACRNDLEGIVAKLKRGTYTSDQGATSWVKIKNPDYTQIQGRDELFEAREP